MRNTIYASFKDPKLAEKAAGALMDHGLLAQDLSIIQSHRWKNLSEHGSLSLPSMTSVEMPVDESEIHSDIETQAKHGVSTTTLGDAERGAIRGSAWGFGVGALAALASLFVPGFGLVIGGGALATAIAGLAASAGAGAAAGAMTGYLKDQGVESHVVAQYEQTIHNGGAVLGATIPSGEVDESRAWEILNKYAGQNVTSYAARPYLS